MDFSSDYESILIFLKYIFALLEYKLDLIIEQ